MPELRHQKILNLFNHINSESLHENLRQITDLIGKQILTTAKLLVWLIQKIKTENFCRNKILEQLSLRYFPKCDILQMKYLDLISSWASGRKRRADWEDS